MKRGIVFFVILISFIFGCTKRKNPTGFVSNFEMKTKTINWEYFDRNFSYQDSIRNSDFSDLILANYNNIKSSVLLKFKSFPDSVYEVQNAKIKLVINKRYNFETISQNDLIAGKMLTNWKEKLVTWFTTGDTIEWKNSHSFSEEDVSYFDIENFEVIEDTITFEFNSEIVKNWINSDSLNYGLVLSTEKDSSFIIFNSSETGMDDLEPTLTFDYKITENDTILHYQKNAYYDTFIYHKTNGDELESFENSIYISGIMPTTAFIHFNLPDSVFLNDETSGISNLYDLHRITVLRAELVLYKKEENSYPISGNIDIKPYLVISDSITNNNNPTLPLEYKTDYISYGKITTDSLSMNEFKIDVTSVVQSVMSGTYNNNGVQEECHNYGMLLKTPKENISLEYIRFYDINSDQEDKRPKLIIKYLTPKFDY